MLLYLNHWLILFTEFCDDYDRDKFICNSGTYVCCASVMTKTLGDAKTLAKHLLALFEKKKKAKLLLVNESCTDWIHQFSFLIARNHWYYFKWMLSFIFWIWQPPLSGHGEGRLLTLDHPMMIKDAIRLIKSHLKLDFVRLGLGQGKTNGRATFLCTAL